MLILSYSEIMEETTKSILDKLPAKWFLAIVAVLGLIIAIYSSFLKKDVPQFEYEILSQVSVFNQYDEVSSLRILLDTIDVQQNMANITFYTIKVANNGTMHINHNMYDKSCFGLQIVNGIIIKAPTIINASSDYISKRFNEIATSHNKEFLHIPYMPLDIGDYYIMRFGIYHNDSIKPSFISEGIISGQQQINIIDLSNVKKTTFIQEVFGGKWHIQLSRLIVYGILSIILLIAILYIVLELIPDLRSKSKRKKFIQSINKERIIQKVINDYQLKGEYYIQSVYSITSLGSTKLTNNYNASKVYVANSGNASNKDQFIFHMERIRNYDALIKEGYLDQQGRKITVDISLKQSVDLLYGLLKSNKLL